MTMPCQNNHTVFFDEQNEQKSREIHFGTKNVYSSLHNHFVSVFSKKSFTILFYETKVQFRKKNLKTSIANQ